MRKIFVLAALAWAAGCATPMAATGAVGATRTAAVSDAAGRAIGNVRFTETSAGVLIHVELQPGTLTPGWHGVHLHEVGSCSDAAMGYKMSGSHVGHGSMVQHGLLNPRGPEAGDLPNLFAPAAGPISAEFLAPRATLSARSFAGRMPLLDADGAALIIHAAPDDQTTQPIGGAGARVACAAIR